MKKRRQNNEMLAPRVTFDWPMKEGHGAFCIETQRPFNFCDPVTKEWEYGINIGNFPAPTADDIMHWRTGTRRMANVELYKFQVSKRGKRTGRTIQSWEMFFDRDDPRPPIDLTVLLISQTESRE